MADPATSAYIHGTSPGEQERLSLLNAFVNDACLREIRLAPGQRVLDVGSGLGQFTRLMGRAVAPDGAALGIERDAEQRAGAARRARDAGEAALAEFREGDAARLPLRPDERGTFDVVFARFVLEHLPDPAAAVGEMVSAVRSGGRVVLADDDHDSLRLHPEPPGVMPAWRAYIRAYEDMGCDPYIGRRLVALLHEAGARPRRSTILFFGACAGHETFPAVVRNFAGILLGARERIVAGGVFEARAFDDAIASLRAWEARPDAALWYGICWAEGTRPA
jgi:ubiquinone/menaquinone biosynthesis C-methylase UbiE